MDDKKIIELFYERSEQAITELSKKYGLLCEKIADNILNNHLDAEECVNDAYLAVWNTIPPQNPDSLVSYVCRIVRNQAIKKYHENTALKRNSIYDTSLDELEEDTAALGRPSMSLKITPGTVFDQPRESFSVYTGNLYYMVDNTDLSFLFQMNCFAIVKTFCGYSRVISFAVPVNTGFYGCHVFFSGRECGFFYYHHINFFHAVCRIKKSLLLVYFINLSVSYAV